MRGLFKAFIVGISFLYGCTDSSAQKDMVRRVANPIKKSINKPVTKHFEGSFSNGMKGDKISFDISADGKKLENLTFKGYWRCGGRLESTAVGPDGAFNIIGNKVNEHIAEPPDGGSTAWRFDLNASIDGNAASGTFRMNINNLGCDTYKLIWTAKAIGAK